MFQSARSRQHRSRIVDKQIDFFLLIVSMGRSLGNQIKPVGPPRRAQSSQIEPARAPRSDPDLVIEPTP